MGINPIRTPTIDFDNAFSSQVDQVVQYQEACFALKTALVNAGWTVKSSSNGTVATASDNWASSADIVFSSTGTNPRSWVILAAPAAFIAAGASALEILLDCNNASADTTPQQMQTILADTAYPTTGLSVNAPPANAGNVTTANTSGDDIIPWASVVAGRWTSWYTSRGDVMFGVKPEGVLSWRHFWILTSNEDGNGGGQGGHRWMFWSMSSTSADVTTGANMTTSANWRAFDPTGATDTAPEASSASWNIGSWTNGLNYQGVSLTLPIDLYADVATSGRYYGNLVDIYAVPTSLPNAELDTTENEQTYRRICMGDIMHYVPRTELPFA